MAEPVNERMRLHGQMILKVAPYLLVASLVGITVTWRAEVRVADLVLHAMLGMALVPLILLHWKRGSILTFGLLIVLLGLGRRLPGDRWLDRAIVGSGSP